MPQDLRYSYLNVCSSIILRMFGTTFSNDTMLSCQHRAIEVSVASIVTAEPTTKVPNHDVLKLKHVPQFRNGLPFNQVGDVP